MVDMYCEHCKREVQVQKDFNTFLFILLLCFTCVGWIFYLIYYYKRRPYCPICSLKDTLRPIKKDKSKIPKKPQIVEETQPQELTQQPTEDAKFCPSCGTSVTEKFCPACGEKIYWKK